ncbi:MAG: N5-glutamine methyltransferase family protein, partial [Nitrospiria bacterium]
MMQTVSTETRVLCVSAALREGAAYLKQRGIDTPQREAEHLLSAVLRCSRLHLLLEGQSGLPQAAHDRFWRYLRRRATREPLQYITGQVEFCGMTLSVSKGVFIPRPETELIVEAAKTLPPPRRILDLCTGSGALAVTLA